MRRTCTRCVSRHSRSRGRSREALYPQRLHLLRGALLQVAEGPPAGAPAKLSVVVKTAVVDGFDVFRLTAENRTVVRQTYSGIRRL